MALERDGDGYLMSMADWSEDVMHEMAKADDYELTPEKIEQIMKAREYYDENSTVPAIRVFAKYIGMDKKDMFKMWLTGPMKPITKYGGLPKPTGCV
jgi:tRNA 2-thiouridine synthesizing protein E